jgi:hypothetical protein
MSWNHVYQKLNSDRGTSMHHRMEILGPYHRMEILGLALMASTSIVWAGLHERAAPVNRNPVVSSSDTDRRLPTNGRHRKAFFSFFRKEVVCVSLR